MTVADLIEKLKGMDQSLQVFTWNVDPIEQDGCYENATRVEILRMTPRWKIHDGKEYRSASDGQLSVVVIS